MSDHDKSYTERNSVGFNKAELIFERYCESRGVDYRKLGFDEKDGYIKGFFNVPPLLRSLPDYIVSMPGNIIYFIHVKGTNKLKISDLINYGAFSRMYTRHDVRLHMAFCFESNGEEATHLISWSKIEKQLLLGQRIKQFDSDKKLYLEIPI